MSVYTTQVRWICEQIAIDQGYEEHDIPTIIKTSIPFVFKWPINWFNDRGNEIYFKILAHYYTQEIGLETPALWQWKMYEHLNLVAPYYNQLYESAAFDYKPLEDYDMYKEHHGTETESNKGGNDEQNTYDRNTDTGNVRDTTNQNTRNTTNSHLDLFSDTPQGRLQEVVNGVYLTDARSITDTGKITDDGTGKITDKGNETSKTIGDIKRSNFYDKNGSEEFAEHIHGKLGGKSYQQLIQEYRDLILNIDEMIVNSCKPLFMQVWEVF